MDNFGKYLKIKQNDKKTFMEKRLGFGSFIGLNFWSEEFFFRK